MKKSTKGARAPNDMQQITFSFLVGISYLKVGIVWIEISAKECSQVGGFKNIEIGNFDYTLCHSDTGTQPAIIQTSACCWVITYRMLILLIYETSRKFRVNNEIYELQFELPPLCLL